MGPIFLTFYSARMMTRNRSGHPSVSKRGKFANNGEFADIIMSLRKSALKHRSNAAPGKRRFGLHRYLTQVYRIYIDLLSKRISKSATCQIADLAGIRVRKSAHPIRLLIDASIGPEDPKQKSRWVAALRYVHGWRLPPRKVRWCFSQHGGVYGCARKYAALNKAARHRRQSRWS
jgi:hypothetical protein